MRIRVRFRMPGGELRDRVSSEDLRPSAERVAAILRQVARRQVGLPSDVGSSTAAAVPDDRPATGQE